MRAAVRRARVVALLAGALALCAPGVIVARAPAPAWTVYAIRYATIRGFPLNGLVAGADSTRQVDIAMTCWLLESAGRRVLVDAGFHRRKFLDAWKPADYVTPAEALRRLGVAPESVDDLVLTHVHWDHVDGADLFPDARVWMQRAEHDHYVSADGLPADAGIDSLDAAMLARIREQGRMRFVEGDGREILPGITAYTGGRHTFASQFLAVRTAKGTAVLAVDDVYLYENLTRRRPIAQTDDPAANLAAQARMRRLASRPRLLVPGHDPDVFRRFPQVAPGVVRIE